jgi:hypothetical protein
LTVTCNGGILELSEQITEIWTMKNESAIAAKEIRTILKKQYPEYKFSVRSEVYSMGSSINVEASTPVSEEHKQEIIALADQYQACDFDGMDDSTTYRKNQKNLPRAKYVFCKFIRAAA